MAFPAPIELALMLRMKTILLYALTCFGFGFGLAYANRASDLVNRFRMAPNSTSAVVGSSVTIFCSFYQMPSRSMVVWSKNDIIIVDDAVNLRIEEYYQPRYSIVGEPSKFEYNLLITNVQLEDDGRFTCQRPPTTLGYPALIETAKLSVLVPCETPEIVNYHNGSTVTIDPALNESVKFECNCKKGKPKADIRWHLNDEALIEGSSGDTQINIQFNQYEIPLTEQAFLETTTSEINLLSEHLEQGDRLWCVCLNAAMRDAVSTYIQFNVLTPPSSPTIDSSPRNGPVIVNTVVTLRCTAQSGNPAGNMTWQRTRANQTSILPLKYSYAIANGTLFSDISFTVTPNDTDSTFECVVQNSVSSALFAQYNLNVLFGPAAVDISGKLYAKIGEQLQVACTSGPSNPAAIASWDCPNQSFTQIQVTDSTVRSAIGHVTVSQLSAMLPSRNSIVTCRCTMRNPTTAESFTKSVNLSSANPPHQVLISKSVSENALLENTTVLLVCIASGSFPPASLSWYVGDDRVQTETHRVQPDQVMSNLTVRLRRQDNAKALRCDATNVATDRPISASVSMSVYYPPHGVHVTVEPEVIREGSDVTLTCEAGSSNPTSDISWFRNGAQVYSTSTVDIADPHGGWQKRSIVQFNARLQDDATSWRCVVNHEASDSELASELRLSVRHRPALGPLNRTYSLLEGHSWILTVPLRANPQARTFMWSFNNSELLADSNLQIDDNLLRIARVRRTMTGLYKLGVANPEGSNNIEFYIDVLYQISIKQISNRTVDVGQSVSFECHYDGNPVNADSVSWLSMSSRSVDLQRRMDTKRDSANRIMHLVISNVSWDDAGSFVCVGDNRVSNQPAATREALLIVRFPPRIETRTRYLKAAARVGEFVELTCTVQSYPCAEVNWQMKVEYSYTILTNSSELSIVTRQVSAADSAYRCTLLSRLRIAQVRNSSYGMYRCTARNQLSSLLHPRVHADIPLVEPSRPDSPTSFELLNATTNGVTLRWHPAFNGGHPQSFEIIYYDMRSGAAQKPIVVSDNQQLDYLYVTIDSLKMNTEYHVSLVCSNKLGESEQRLTLIARTVDSVPLSNDRVLTDNSKSLMFGMPVIVFVMVGVIILFLVLLNIVLVIVCMRRRRTQRKANACASATPVRNANGNVLNGQHAVQFSPLIVERAHGDDRYGLGIGSSTPFGTQIGFNDANEATVQFLNGGSLTYHRTSDPSDIQNITLNDFAKEAPQMLRYTPSNTMDFSHPDMMEILQDRSTPTVSYQLKRSVPITECSTLDDGSAVVRANNQAEVHSLNSARLNGASIYIRNGARESPKHYVTFDANEHNSASSTMPRNVKNATALSTNANYVPVIYKPQAYQRSASNGCGSDRQRASAATPSPLNWASEEAEI